MMQRVYTRLNLCTCAVTVPEICEIQAVVSTAECCSTYNNNSTTSLEVDNLKNDSFKRDGYLSVGRLLLLLLLCSFFNGCFFLLFFCCFSWLISSLFSGLLSSLCLLLQRQSRTRQFLMSTEHSLHVSKKQQPNGL
jgi:hypothetical protein